ncbi:MAG: diguanylate cyclase [Thermanaerothrix sp.]|nr:diguanylate cyclase [Thermanaerothrix sp.]
MMPANRFSPLPSHSPASLRRTFQRLLRGLLLITLVFILLTTATLIYRTESLDWHNRQLEAARYLATRVQAYLQQMTTNLQALALIGLDEAGQQPRRVQQLFDLYPDYDLVQVIAPDNRVELTLSRNAPPTIQLVTLPQARWLAEARAGRIYLSPFQLSPQGRPYLLLAVPAEKKRVIAAQISLQSLWERTRAISLGRRGVVYLAERSGRILAHPDPQVVLRGSSLPEEVRAVLPTLDQSVRQEWGVTADGTWVERTLLPIPNTEWVVIAEVPGVEVHANSLLSLGILGGGVLLLGLLLSLGADAHLRRQVLTPLEHLRQGALALSAGHLEHRLNIQRPEELRQVAQAFNTMAQTLHAQQAALARQAEALTHLYQLATLLNAAEDLESAYKATLDTLFTLFPQIRAAYIFVRDAQGGLTLAASRRAPASSANDDTLPPTAPNPQRWLASTAPRVYIEGGHALIALQGRDSMLGLLRVEAQASSVWNESEQRWLAMLGDQLAHAIQTLSLYEHLRQELTERRRAEEALRQAHADLEERVHQRTQELRRLNRELMLSLTERNFTQERLQRQKQQLETLRRATLELTAYLDLQTLLQSLVRHAVDIVNADAGGFYLYEPAHDHLVRVISLGERALPLGLIVRRGEGLSGRVLQSREPILITDYRNWEGRLTQIPQESEVYAVIGLPVQWGDDFLGVLNVATFKERTFSQEEVNLLNLFAIQAAIAIRNARILENERRQRRRAEALAKVNAALTTSLDLKPLLLRVLEAATEAIPAADRGSVLLLDPQSGELVIEALYGYTDLRIYNLRFPRESGYAAKALREGRPILIPDARADDEVRYDGEIEEVRQVRSAIAAPMFLHEEPVGVITLDCSHETHAFTLEDLELLKAFADQAAIAIRNVRLYEREKHLAITDELTQVYNRRYALQLAEREIERARRYQRPLAMILADIDHFKLVNDTYGHLAGDEVLRDLAQRCRRQLRDFDVLGRYGGEEFLVVLPEADAEAALGVAERLRRAVAETPFNGGAHHIQVTLSLGVVAFIRDHPDLNLWLTRVDAALYQAKASGRNRAVLWQGDGNGPDSA